MKLIVCMAILGLAQLHPLNEKEDGSQIEQEIQTTLLSTESTISIKHTTISKNELVIKQLLKKV